MCSSSWLLVLIGCVKCHSRFEQRQTDIWICVFNPHVTQKDWHRPKPTHTTQMRSPSGWPCLRVTRFDTPHESWRNVSKMATNSSRRRAEMLCSLNATRMETSVGGIACIRTLLQQTETKAAARTLLSLFTRKHGQAWQDTQDKKKWLLVVVSSFCVNHQSMALASFWWDSGHPFPLVSMFPHWRTLQMTHYCFSFRLWGVIPV